MKGGGLRATFRTAADRAAQGQARFGGCRRDQVLQGAAGAADEAPPPEEPEESEAFLKDVAAAMAEEITGGAGGSRAALAAGWTGRYGRGGAPWLAIAAGDYAWKETEKRNRVCIRETEPCSCRRCRPYCVACERRLPDHPVPKPQARAGLSTSTRGPDRHLVALRALLYSVLRIPTSRMGSV